MIVSIKTIRNSVALLILTFVINTTSNAQCKTEIKEGIKKLNPYTHNGQINNGVVSGGKPVEFHLSFYKGLRYRLQLVSEAALGSVTFKVFDKNKNEVFNSTETDEDFWDFLSTSSQELIVEVRSTDNSKKGCVAVLVGMRSSKVTSNPIRDL